MNHELPEIVKWYIETYRDDTADPERRLQARLAMVKIKRAIEMALIGANATP